MVSDSASPAASPAALAQCPYCGVGCGLELKAPAEPGGLWTARGDRHHPSSLGQVCIKGAKRHVQQENARLSHQRPRQCQHRRLRQQLSSRVLRYLH